MSRGTVVGQSTDSISLNPPIRPTLEQCTREAGCRLHLGAAARLVFYIRVMKSGTTFAPVT